VQRCWLLKAVSAQIYNTLPVLANATGVTHLNY
jgi:hypothetical protein